MSSFDPIDVRKVALVQSVKSFTDFEQPRNARGYNALHYRTAPTTQEILDRAKAFEKYIDGATANV